MADIDNSHFYTDPVAGVPWEYASRLIDEAFLRLRVTVGALATGGFLRVKDEGLDVGQRGTMDFVGEIVTAADDESGDRVVVTLPNWGTPGGLGNANAAGIAETVARADHVHKRDVRVRAAGVDVGTRNAINFVSGFTVVDDPGGDEVEVTAAGGGGLSPLTTIVLDDPQLVWDDDGNLVMAEGG
jgi:hypothetical protein